MSNEFNPQSLDATLATIIADQKANHCAVMDRFDAQRTELVEIKAQAMKTNGRVTGLEQRERDRNVKLATIATIFTGIGTVAGYVIPQLVHVIAGVLHS